MSYSQIGFPQLFIGNGTVATTGDSGDLAAGDLGLYDKKTNAVVTSSNYSSHPYAYLAQGSYYSQDSIGNTPLVGMKESLKSKGINANYVTRFYKQVYQAPQSQIIQIGGNSSIQFQADFTYRLRVEFKGSPVLRTLNRHMYKQVPYFTGCASTDCLTGCDKEYVDPASVMLGWSDYINNDPLLKLFGQTLPFIQTSDTGITANATAGVNTAVTLSADPAVAVGKYVIGAGIFGLITAYNSGTNVATITGTVSQTGSAIPVVLATLIDDTYNPDANSTTIPTKVAFLVIKVAYVDTVFGDCSFNPVDFYQKEPIILYTSLVNELGDPCEDQPVLTFNNYVNTNTAEIQTPIQPQGLGETVVRDYIAARELQGIHFNRDPRRREVEIDPTLTVVNRTHYFTRYYIQYSVPQFNNPSNTFSNNQFLLGVAFDSGNSASAFETLITGWLAANNPNVSLETL